MIMLVLLFTNWTFIYFLIVSELEGCPLESLKNGGIVQCV